MKPATVHATFKTLVGEITARTHLVINRVLSETYFSAIAYMTDVHVFGDWTVILSSRDDRIEWRHDGVIVGTPFDYELKTELRNQLLTAARVMLAWFHPNSNS